MTGVLPGGQVPDIIKNINYLWLTTKLQGQVKLGHNLALQCLSLLNIRILKCCLQGKPKVSLWPPNKKGSFVKFHNYLASDHTTGCPKKMFISKKGAQLTNEHFFLGHLVYNRTSVTPSWDTGKVAPFVKVLLRQNFIVVLLKDGLNIYL